MIEPQLSTECRSSLVLRIRVIRHAGGVVPYNNIELKRREDTTDVAQPHTVRPRGTRHLRAKRGDNVCHTDGSVEAVDRRPGISDTDVNRAAIAGEDISKRCLDVADGGTHRGAHPGHDK